MLLPIRVLLTFAAVALLAAPAAAQSSFVAFESGPVRPLAISPNGAKLFAVNTPDNRLEIYKVEDFGLVSKGSVPVGLEPVAVAARTDTEVWVVNHLSDSISILTLDANGWRVTRTLLVGDEPRDIVFAGTGGNRAFITTAHRGQHRTHSSISGVTGAGDPQLTTAGVDRADVWVFDAAALPLDTTLGGTPLEIVTMFGDTPRALAVSPDGNTVYAAVFHSGNQTAPASEGLICDGFGSAGSCSGDGITSPNGLGSGNIPGGNPGPAQNSSSEAAPEVGLILKYDNGSGQWRDERGLNFSNAIRFNLPDQDVFTINANTLAVGTDYPHVGTILFNMVTNPVNGNIYVSNTDANNAVRFEGPGGGGSTVQGNIARSRITVITPGTGDVEPRHLNKHIDYGVLPAPAGIKAHSLANPVEMVVSSDGATLYVAAFGSSKVGVIDTADLENDLLWDDAGAEFDPTVESANYIDVSGGGPSGLVLDESSNRMFVYTRFDNGISIVDTNTGTETGHVNFHNPEPANVIDGRFMLYDALQTSSNGEASCSSCHVFGDFDSLAWDLGNPDDANHHNPQVINLGIGAPGDINGTGVLTEFSSMKGPMTTQTLRGMETSGHMHWRGDRSNGFFGEDSPNTNDSDLSFRNFIVAFPGLVGMDIDLSGGPGANPAFEADVQSFADFMLDVRLPPNPVRALDNSLDTDQQAGRDFYFGDHGGNDCSDGLCFPGAEGVFGFSCNGCHTLDASQGFFGTGGNASFENEPQILKIPHLRNLYQKVGMFGVPDNSFTNAGDNAHKGDQVRGTGFLHDGSEDTLFRFFQAVVFNNSPGNNAGFDGGDNQRRDVEQFMLAFDTDIAPIVGQQATLDGGNLGIVGGRITLLEQRARANFTSLVLGGAVKECDLIVSALVAKVRRGWLYQPGTDDYRTDRVAEPAVSRASLEALAGGTAQELTWTCVPPGSGVRVALDRDEDGFLDGDERDDKTETDNAASFLGACNNGIDDDGDGDIDLADGGCFNATWNNEEPECDDGLDNDGDGNIDLADAQCGGSSSLNREALVNRTSCGLIGLEVLPLLALGALRRRRQR